MTQRASARGTGWLLMLLALVGVLGLAACGGDSKRTTAASSDPPAGTTRTTPAAQRPSGFRAALIGLDDLSPGWKREPTIEVGVQCRSFRPFGSAVKLADSGSLHRGYAFIQQVVGLFRSEDASSRAYRELTSARAERCVRSAMYRRMQFESGASTAFVEPVQVGRVDTLGPESRAVRYTTTFRGEIGTGDAYIVAMNARSGRSVANLTAISSLQPFAEAAYEKLGKLLNERLDAARG